MSAPCPVCRKPSVKEAAPFCSARCRNVDLQRWFSGAYVVPASSPEEEEDLPAGPPPDDDEA